jgi:hypothetical protein
MDVFNIFFWGKDGVQHDLQYSEEGAMIVQETLEQMSSSQNLGLV